MPAADETPPAPPSPPSPPSPSPSSGPGRGPTIKDLPAPPSSEQDDEPAPSEELRARTGFPRPPRGTSPNCGPERRFSVDRVDSRARFVELLRGLQARDRDDSSSRFHYDNFRNPPATRGANGKRIDGGEIDWRALEQAVITEVEGGVTYHRLEYRPLECSQYTVTMTNTGAASVYGCCGK